MDDTLRMQRFKEVESYVQDAYSSFQAARFNRQLIEKYQIGQKKQSDFIDMKGDYVLKLTNAKKFRDALTDEFALSQQQCEQLIENIDSEIKNFEQGRYDTAKNTNTLSQSTYKKEEVSETTLTNKESEKETVKPMRTMAEDMQKVHGYGAQVADVEEETDASTEADEPIHRSEQAATLAPAANATVPIYSEETTTPQTTAQTTDDTTSEPKATSDATEPSVAQPTTTAAEPAVAQPPAAPEQPADAPEQPAADTRWHSTHSSPALDK